MRPEKFIENFSTHLKNVIARSISLATRLNEKAVSPLHILYACLQETGSIASEILKALEIKDVDFSDFTKKTTNKISTDHSLPLPELNNSARQILEKAMFIAYEKNHNYVGTEHLLFSIAISEDKEVKDFFNYLKINPELVSNKLDKIIENGSRFPDMEKIKESMDFHDDHNEPILPPMPMQKDLQKINNQNPTAVQMFTTHLSDRKNSKKFDPIIGREKEIDRLINILSRRTKNNPVLVGEPGVGKTAIVEGLAKRIATGDVPDILKKKKILSLDLTLMISGTIYRGEFEARLKQIIDEVSNKPDYILFIDELHNIIGAGSNQGTMDAANILKPALSRGMLRCIGATTIDEYKKHITSDPALERRFQSINVEEPSKEEALQILKGIKKHYENFHNTQITDSAIAAAVELSSRYIHDNFLPDKAIDLLDESAAATRTKQKFTPLQNKYYETEIQLQNCQEKKADAIHAEDFDLAYKLKEEESKLQKKLSEIKKDLEKEKKPTKKKVTEKNVAEILSSRVGIPTDYLLQNEWDRISQLQDNLKNHIVGQDETIEKITKALRLSHLRLSEKKQPLASFLFAGPSGVGKTEMAKKLALELYQDEKSLVKLDMSEFSEQHSVSRLLGSPAGYVGYKERNRFLDEIGRKPYAILLFDEIDKAHPDVQKLLLQILDEGVLTDSHGKKINLEHSIIILTTNIGAEFYKSSGIGFGASEQTNNSIDKKTQSSVEAKLKEEFGAALLSRIQNIFLFAALNRSHIEQIIAKNLEKLNQKLQNKQNIQILHDDKILSALADHSYTADNGARNVEQTIQTIVHNLIAETIAKQKKKTKYNLVKIANDYKLV